LPNVELAAGAYYVVTSDAAFFLKATKTATHQWKSGTLGNTGETIQLWSDAGVMVDSVRFRAVAPWPTTANGNGPSMELCDLASNNDLGGSWAASTTAIGYSLNNQNGQAVPMLGTPGKANKCTGGGGGGTGSAPIIKDLTAQTNKNTAVNINIAQLNGLGGGGGGGTNTITNSGAVKPATNGNVTKPTGGGGVVNNNVLTYTPNNGFVGIDKFDYFVCTAGGCDSASITVRVVEPVFNNSTIGKITAQTAVLGTAPDSLNRFVEIEGIVHSPNYSTTGIQFTLIDSKYKTDGIEAVRATTVGGYKVIEGDRLKVRGRIAQTNNVNRIVIDSLWVKESNVKLQEPTLVSILDESTENMLVTLSEVSIVDSTKWTNTATGNFFVVEVTPDNGATKYQVRIDKDLTDLSNWKAPKGKFDLVGIGFQGVAAAGGGGIPTTSAPYQIMPRYIKDFKFPLATNDALLGQNISVFPNPFNEEIIVTMKEQMDFVVLKDMLGRAIAKIAQPAANQTIDTKDLMSGVYFISVQKDGRQFVTKVVKQ
jgi:Secretion system C-terminal sorting domain/Bacterial Ig domain